MAQKIESNSVLQTNYTQLQPGYRHSKVLARMNIIISPGQTRQLVVRAG